MPGRPGNVPIKLAGSLLGEVASPQFVRASSTWADLTPPQDYHCTMSLLREGYTDVNRAFLQAFMSRSVMKMDEIRPILAAILNADSTLPLH